MIVFIQCQAVHTLIESQALGHSDPEPSGALLLPAAFPQFIVLAAVVILTLYLFIDLLIHVIIYRITLVVDLGWRFHFEPFGLFLVIVHQLPLGFGVFRLEVVLLLGVILQVIEIEVVIVFNLRLVLTTT